MKVDLGSGLLITEFVVGCNGLGWRDRRMRMRKNRAKASAKVGGDARYVDVGSGRKCREETRRSRSTSRAGRDDRWSGLGSQDSEKRSEDRRGEQTKAGVKQQASYIDGENWTAAVLADWLMRGFMRR